MYVFCVSITKFPLHGEARFWNFYLLLCLQWIQNNKNPWNFGEDCVHAQHVRCCVCVCVCDSVGMYMNCVQIYAEVTWARHYLTILLIGEIVINIILQNLRFEKPSQILVLWLLDWLEITHLYNNIGHFSIGYFALLLETLNLRNELPISEKNVLQYARVS